MTTGIPYTGRSYRAAAGHSRGRCLPGIEGLLFTAGAYPLVGGLLHPVDSDTGDTMMMSLYFALGSFLLWRRGDHLTKTNSSIFRLRTRVHRDSPLATA